MVDWISQRGKAPLLRFWENLAACSDNCVFRRAVVVMQCEVNLAVWVSVQPVAARVEDFKLQLL